MKPRNVKESSRIDSGIRAVFMNLDHPMCTVTPRKGVSEAVEVFKSVSKLIFQTQGNQLQTAEAARERFSPPKTILSFQKPHRCQRNHTCLGCESKSWPVWAIRANWKINNQFPYILHHAAYIEAPNPLDNSGLTPRISASTAE